MKIFLSSVIRGMEEYRAAARQAVETLGHTAVAAEDFRVSPNSPQQVCLAGVREADLVVLLLGARYGTAQTSGFSPTHEEYHEVRGRKPVFTFVQADVTPDPDQEKFIEEVGTWEAGGYWQPFDTPASLAAAVTRGLHEWELSQQAGPVNEPELITRTTALLPQRPNYSTGTAMLHVAVAGAPAQQVLRPGQLDDQTLQRDLEQEALYGEHPIFDRGQGVQVSVSGNTLVIQQATAQIALDEQGSVRISLPGRDVGRRTPVSTGIASLIEEDVRDRVSDAIRYAGWLLDRVDPPRRLSRVGLACRLDGIGYLPWRTRAEVAASPNRANLSMAGLESAQSPPVVLPRAALLFNGVQQAEDITVRLRRQAKR